jgi:formyl-CoA transferase
MGRPALAGDPRFATLADRLANVAALDEEIGRWTAGLVATAAAELLQQVGVAATASMSPALLFDDPHLADREAWVHFTHPVQGDRVDVALPWRFSDGTPTYGPAPLLGQHDDEVYRGLLGMSEDEIATLRDEGVLA